jgi:hypothetical protein
MSQLTVTALERAAALRGEATVLARQSQTAACACGTVAITVMVDAAFVRRGQAALIAAARAAGTAATAPVLQAITS